MGPRRETVVAEHLTPLGIAYDADVVGIVRQAGEALGGVRANAAFRLWEDGADPDTVIDEVARYEMTTRARAQKTVEFLLHPTWRVVHLLLRGGPATVPARSWRVILPASPGSSPSSSRLEISSSDEPAPA